MTPHDAFLQDILDDPDDDAVRLIFADWLTEQDDPRGEFIRVQCELAGLSPGEPRWPGLDQRQRDLLLAHQEEWAGPLPGLVRRFNFRRGFPHEVEMTVPEFVDRGDGLLRAAPMAEVRLLRASAQLHLLAGCEALRRLRGLSLSYGHLNDGAVHTLARLPGLEGLRVLLLDHNFIRGGGALALAGSPHLCRLTRLDLR